jgi:hypothetical protein
MLAWTLAAVVVGFLLPGVAWAEAERSEEPAAMPLGKLSVSGSGGIGVGAPDVGVRFGLGTDFWASTHLGVGLAGVTYLQTSILSGPEIAVTGFAPTVMARMPMRRMSLRAGFGGGRAKVEYRRESGWLLVGPSRIEHYVSWYFTGNVGLVWHLKRHFWLAGSVSGDVIVERDGIAKVPYLVTPNMVIGWNLW